MKLSAQSLHLAKKLRASRSASALASAGLPTVASHVTSASRATTIFVRAVRAPWWVAMVDSLTVYGSSGHGPVRCLIRLTLPRRGRYSAGALRSFRLCFCTTYLPPRGSESSVLAGLANLDDQCPDGYPGIAGNT